jgi:hypothetical protein
MRPSVIVTRTCTMPWVSAICGPVTVVVAPLRTTVAALPDFAPALVARSVSVASIVAARTMPVRRTVVPFLVLRSLETGGFRPELEPSPPDCDTQGGNPWNVLCFEQNCKEY